MECLENGKYYKVNSLKPNHAKTQVCAFHLSKHLALRKLNVPWEGQNWNTLKKQDT